MLSGNVQRTGWTDRLILAKQETCGGAGARARGRPAWKQLRIELGLEDESATCSRHNIEFLSLPVADLGAPGDSNGFIVTARQLIRIVRAGGSIAMHCRQSVGRSGLLAVSVAMASGMSLDMAVDVVSRARGVPVPETKEQRECNLRRPTGITHHP